MTAISSDAESLREQIATALEADDVGRGYRARAKRFYRGQADALIAAVPALQHASSDLHGADRLLIASLVSFALAAPSNDASVAARDRVVAEARALLDTAQPDLRRTPEAEIDNELQIARLERDQQERFKWAANERADAAEAMVARLRADLDEMTAARDSWRGHYAAVTALHDLDAKLAATPAPAEEERQTLMYVEHEIAAFIHPLHWSGSHDPEPGDGSDCHLCYEDAERLIERVVRATKAAE